MQVNSAAAATANSTPSTSSSSSSAASGNLVDYNSFLELLIAEMKNQDPTSPSDPTQYLSQLASFSVVGQSIQTNNKLDTILTTSTLSQAESAIGRTVTSADGSISGKVVSVTIAQDGSISATLDSGKKMTLGAGVTFS